MNPDQHTIQEFHLDVGNGHEIYVHDWGNPDAKDTLVLLHGGPGNGTDDRDKKPFDPKKHHVVFFDQRGSGKSLPTGSLRHNTTDDLVEDIKKISKKLSLENIIIIGGSWGSTLALAYSIKYPETVKTLIINGIFSGTKAENDWISGGGWREFYPEIWENYVASVPSEHAKNPTSFHINEVASGDAERIKRSAYAFETMELALLKLDDIFEIGSYDTYEPQAILIEMHYDKNNFFMQEKYIFNNAQRLTMPVYIIQGRYDMVTPPRTAYELSKKLPNAQLIWTINGHLRQHEAHNVQKLLLDKITGAE